MYNYLGQSPVPSPRFQRHCRKVDNPVLKSGHVGIRLIAQFVFEQQCFEYFGLLYNLAWGIGFETVFRDSFDDDMATVFKVNSIS